MTIHLRTAVKRRRWSVILMLWLISCAIQQGSGSKAVHESDTGRSNLATSEATLSEPRCQPTDPGCGPMPFGHKSAEYAPNRPRIVDGPLNPNRPGACSHDGECFNSGCGYSCLSVRNGHHVWFDCIDSPSADARLRHDFCGCVEGNCRWFRQ
jgi:hypothetical protein